MSDRGWIAWLVGILVVLLMLAVAGVIYSEREWKRFAARHECKVIGETTGSSSVGVGVGTNGGVAVVPIFTPGKTGYACNDGKQYWR